MKMEKWKILFLRTYKLFHQLFHRSYGEILMLHRVVEERSLLENNRNLEITPAFLEQTILKYKTAGYCFVSLDEVQQQVESRKRGRHKFVCFTLDDGYADNYEQAYPVFKKYDCPFAIYVSTDFPDKKAQLWWYHLQDVVLGNEKLTLNGVEYDCSDLKKKNQAFMELRKKVFTLDVGKTLKSLEQLFIENNYVARRDMNALTLSWEQIAELAADPLCTIGAHTISHVALSGLSDEMIRKELLGGKIRIEDRIKKPVKHFSYPYGFWNNRVAHLAMEQFSTAVLAGPDGLVRKGDSLDRLNRINLIEKP